MRPWQSDFVGRYEHVTIESAALKGNPLGDDCATARCGSTCRRRTTPSRTAASR